MINKNLELFISLYLRSNIKLSENTSLYEDLNIQKKEDAKIFLTKYSEKFDVDISEMDFDKYFPEHIINKEPFTIGDMERGITLGVLNETTIELEENDANLPLKYTLKNIVAGIILCVICALALGMVAYYL